MRLRVGKDCREWLAAQENEFMQPYAEYLTRSEAQEYCDDSEARAGYYSRLSAPGYMDCTDWSGPYSSVSAAIIGLFEQYGD